MKTLIVIPSRGGPNLQTLLATIRRYTTDPHVVVVGPNAFCPDWVATIDFSGSVSESINLASRLTTWDMMVVIHDDAVLLDQPIDAWINGLSKAITSGFSCVSPLRLSHKSGHKFLYWFCSAVSFAAWKSVGELDSDLFPWSGYDADWCLRAEALGHKLAVSPDTRQADGGWTGSFPIFHRGGGTLVKMMDVDSVTSLDADNLRKKHGQPLVEVVRPSSSGSGVTAHISTKNRYHILPLAIQAIGLQTIRPERLIIFDDSDDPKPIHLGSPFAHQFAWLAKLGVQVSIEKGQRKGQSFNHQSAIDMATTEFIWRVDDDNIPEPDVLEKLLGVIWSNPGIGAVAGVVHFPNMVAPPRSSIASGYIKDIFAKINVQWTAFDTVEFVEHLHNTFLFRKAAAVHGYNLSLSSACHREETIFTHEMFRAGWLLAVDGKARTWHFRDDIGGIRSNTKTNFESDERAFLELAKKWGVTFDKYRLIILDNGLGDHLAFLQVWPRILKSTRSKGYKILLAVCYPEPFEKCDPEGNTELISIDQAKTLAGDIDPYNVYRFMESSQWRGSLVSAYEAMFP